MDLCAHQSIIDMRKNSVWTKTKWPDPDFLLKFTYTAVLVIQCLNVGTVRKVFERYDNDFIINKTMLVYIQQNNT